MTRIAVRGFVGGALRFEEHMDADSVDLAALAKRHTEAMAAEPHMIEVEFLDEPDPLRTHNDD